ncbi:MAG TPA: hypothetical protein VI915_00835 [Thermoplasmata archaeon]|nr:hypothetical protein [Thermoplasmata archaeon]
MTEVVFLASVQGQGTERVRSVSEKLKKRLPDVTVRVLEGAASRDAMAGHKVKFGPAIVIDGRLEYVGIPRLSMLVDRVLQVRDRRPNPRTAGEKPAAPAKPAAPPAAGAAPSPAPLTADAGAT